MYQNVSIDMKDCLFGVFVLFIYFIYFFLFYFIFIYLVIYLFVYLFFNRKVRDDTVDHK